MRDTPISKLLLKLSPPVMLALLIQSIYNIVDSYFVSRYSLNGLTALSLIFPIQLLMSALATGTGTGLNILISRMDGHGETAHQGNIVSSGLCLGTINFLIFACIGMLLIGSYYDISSDQPAVRTAGIQLCTNYFFRILWFVYGVHLQQTAAGQRKYDRPHARSGCRSAHQYRS